jgi:carbon-monoxide dehydrogenase small subunit
VQTTVRCRVNGQERELTFDTRMITADLLRDELRLTSVHIGCATGNCGACTVYLNGRTVKSCCVLAADLEGADVRTVESLASDDGELHPIQEAFIENQGLQCGYCTPAMILAAHALLAGNPAPTRDDIVEAISGNICRCTGYAQIVEAVALAAERLRGANRPPNP